MLVRRRAPAAPPPADGAPWRLVIFDFDGTLSDSGDWFLSIADDLADRFSFRKVHGDEIEMLRGKTTREVIRYLGIPGWKLPRIARFVQAEFGRNTARIALFPGITRMLADLEAAGVRIALCTSNNEANARAILGPENVARIETFECGASLFGKAGKFKRVLRRLHVAPGHAIAIGDETRDITAARKVGMACGAVLWGYANRAVLEAHAPDTLFESPDAITRRLTAAPSG